MTSGLEGAWSDGEPVPSRLVGQMRETPADASRQDLEARIGSDGYVLLRGALDRASVVEARREVFERLEAVGEILPPAVDGIATGTSRRRELAPDLGAFWRGVSEAPALRRVSHGEALRALMARVVGEPVVAFDYIFLRAAVFGRGTKPHFDFPFFTRATSQVRSVWIPLGDVAVCEGPLVVFEGSTRFTNLQEQARGVDVSRDTTRAAASSKAELSESFASIAERYDSRVLTAHFRAGDVVVLGQNTLHGSLENRSTVNRVRLSCDLRYQAAGAPRDERYFGPEPQGVAGGGYAELNGAKPLGEPWHTR